MQRKMISTRVSLTVRLSECDPYGIAHHSNYFVWFEIGRFDYAKKNGYCIPSAEYCGDVAYMTLSTKCKYIKSVTFNDEIEIRTQMNLRMPILYAQFAFHQEMYNKRTGRLVAKCDTVNAAISKVEGRILLINEDKILNNIIN